LGGTGNDGQPDTAGRVAIEVALGTDRVAIGADATPLAGPTRTSVLSGAPVLLFVHDEDGDIQFMCGESGHGVNDASVVGLTHLLEQIRSMADIPVVEPGYAAERSEPGAPWSISAVGE